MPSRDKYADEHRIFLQGIMCKGFLDHKQVHKLHDSALSVCGIDIPEKKAERDQLLVTNVQTINAEISKVGLVIKKGQDEETGKPCFLLMNNSNRIVGGSRELGTSVQSQWSAQELEYLRLVATEILQSEAKAVPSRAALNLTDQVASKGGKKMSLENAEMTVNRLIAARWLKPLEDNRMLTLDVRFIGEMESWMVEVMGADNLAYCKACRKVVVRGVYCGRCSNVAWHKHCVSKQLARGVDVKCGDCGTVVAAAGGEGQASTQQEAPSQVQRGEPSKRSRDRVSRIKEVEDGEEAMEVSQVVGRTSRIKRRMSDDDSDSD